MPKLTMNSKSVLRATVLSLLAFAGLGVLLLWASSRLASHELRQDAARQSRPRVISSRPVDGEQAAPPSTAIRVDLFTPVTGRGVDPTTLNSRSVRIVRVASGELVPANQTAAADGGSIALTPELPLEPGEMYRIVLTGDLRDETGVAFLPYQATFRVAGQSSASPESPHGIAYEQVAVTESIGPSIFTALALGPSTGPDRVRELFAGTADGRIFRYGIAADGTLRPRSVLSSLAKENGGPRLVTGLAFDPADDSVLWVSHGVAALSGAPDFSGKLSTLSGKEYGTYSDRVTGLPRAFKDHMNFGIAFGPDGILYLSQGSNTSVGAPDAKWNNRPERLLSAAILRIDPALLPAEGPLDVTTPDGGGSYDPFTPEAAVKLYATGVRSGYSLLWHSSGRLVTAINGAGRGGSTPPVRHDGALVEGPIMSVETTTDDTLALLTPGSYHGHPNPTRGEHVLMGGNPTGGTDPHEILGYSVGVGPESHFAMPAHSFGKGYSPNGLAEARAAVFHGAIVGDLFVARFSAGDDILILRLDGAGNVSRVISGAPGLTNLASPLALLEDPTNGNLYVTEIDTQRIMLLRPR